MANAAEPVKRVVRPLALSLALWCGLSAGCVELSAFVVPDGKAPPVGVPHLITAAWEGRVMWTPDTLHEGKQVPALAGRLYLMGADGGTPMLGDGAAVVDLYDDTTTAQGGQPVLLEEWRIDDKTLPRLKKRDILGWGYTLVLPWFTLQEHPDVQKIHLTVKYTPKAGAPLFYAGSPMAISLGEVPASFVFCKAPVPNVPVQPAGAQQPAGPQQQVRPAVYSPPLNPTPPPVRQGVYQQPAYPTPPLVPAPVVPPPNPLPSPVTEAARTAPPVPRPEEMPQGPTRVRIGVPRNDRD